jgi:hypothetical protein
MHAVEIQGLCSRRSLMPSATNAWYRLAIGGLPHIGKVISQMDWASTPLHRAIGIPASSPRVVQGSHQSASHRSPAYPRYAAVWQIDTATNHGTRWVEDGEIYVGNFRLGLPHGPDGQQTFPDGRRYTGTSIRHRVGIFFGSISPNVLNIYIRVANVMYRWLCRRGSRWSRHLDLGKRRLLLRLILCRQTGKTLCLLCSHFSSSFHRKGLHILCKTLSCCPSMAKER